MVKELAFYQLFCRAVGCGVMFFVCRSCYRGHAYCCEACRQKARRQQLRAANRRHQQSPEGRSDHRDRQRDYRQRARSCVTDQSSRTGCDFGSISRPLAELQAETPAAEAPDDPLKLTWRERFVRIVCIICGRVGRFIDVFFRRE